MPEGVSASSEDMASLLRHGGDEAYLEEILSYTSERLAKEPELLRDDQQSNQRHLQETAFKNYKAFVTTAECIQKVEHGLTEIDRNLSLIQENIPSLDEECSSYEGFLQGHFRESAQNKQLISNCGSLVDILEVTQLMEICILHGNYDEALDLEAFVKKLMVLHPQVYIVQVLESDAKRLSELMLSQLFERLSGSLQLPECLRIVGYLRRMGIYTENGLREKFLKCRDLWFQSILDEIVKHDHYNYIKRLTDAYRVHMFDITMQYRAIFSDEDSSRPTMQGDAGGSNSSGSSRGANRQRESSLLECSNFLHVWSSRRISEYISALGSHLAYINEGANLSSVLEHCMYCGNSLGRIGLDFRCLLVPLFESAVTDLFKKRMKSAVTLFGAMLDNYKWPNVGLSAGAQGGKGNGSNDDANGNGDNGSKSGTGPPYSLMQHPPLAVLANTVLHTYNELRHCAPQALEDVLTSQLEAMLQEVARTLNWYAVASSLDETERASFRNLSSQFCETLMPYLVTAFDRIYPNSCGKVATDEIKQSVLT